MLIEMIVVLIMISIISIAFIGRYSDSKTDVRVSLDLLKSHIRYTQAKALGTSSGWYILFDASGSPVTYSIHRSDGTVEVFPGESGSSISLATGISVQDGAVVYFDRLGRPITNSGGTALQSGVRTLASSSMGDLNIKPETGYIE